MENSIEDLNAPDSWEVADLDESMKRLMVSNSNSKKGLMMNSSPSSSSFDESFGATELEATSTGSTPSNGGVGGVGEDAINQIDEFLKDALQNPRERLSVLRIEQDVEKFVRDPSRKQLEFQQLPTSYLRLAAHRVAQHYNLQSMVFLDSNLPDGPGSRIIVQKTSECRVLPIRLADIPVNSPQTGNTNSAMKVAIKQRPKLSQGGNNLNSHSSKGNHAKSVEERKEEYNRARARIFSSENLSNSSSSASAKVEEVAKVHSSSQSTSVDERLYVERPESLYDDSSTPRTTRSVRDYRTENEPARYRPNNKVAIIRDREVDRKDPDYDRNYDRYMQRFDPGFGFSGGPYTVQPIYSPAVNYNTEFPQLGAAHRPQLSMEAQTRHMPQHLGGQQWAGTSTPGFGYGPPDAMLSPSTSAVYMHSSHYPRPGMQFINPHEHMHLSFSQPHQQHQHEANYGMARPR